MSEVPCSGWGSLVQHDIPLSSLPPATGLGWDSEVEGLTTPTVYFSTDVIPFPPQFPDQGFLWGCLRSSPVLLVPACCFPYAKFFLVGLGLGISLWSLFLCVRQ